MKKNKILIIITLYSFLISEGQIRGTAYYEKSSSYDFGNTNKVKYESELRNSLNNVNNNISSFEYVLNFNDSVASYHEKKKIDIDNTNKSTRLAKIFSGYKGPYYYNLKDKIINREKGKYLIESSYSKYQWKLLNERIVLNDLICYKATTKIEIRGRRGNFDREIIAWYTPDIPLSIGPDGFAGLPGLILQLENNRVVTTLKKVDFNNKSFVKKLPTKMHNITDEDFDKLMEELVRDRN